MFIFRAIIAFTLLASPALATDCSAWSRFSSTEEYLEPLSIPAAQIGEFLTKSPHSQGIVFSSKRHGEEIWLDIVSYPGDTTAAGASRALMQTGRLAGDDFETLVLTDNGQPLFAFSEPDLRNVGCRFIWAREGGENPIALMRELFKSMKDYNSMRPISNAFNGSLMGDSMTAMSLNNDVLVPKWVMSAVQ